MQIFVRPSSEGLIVRHPEKLDFILPPEGAWVNDSIDWQRYINAGDVLVGEAKEQDTKKKELK